MAIIMTGHLIHIGFPKTGSNFLRRWFAGHPQLAYVDGGIGGFESVYAIAREGARPRDEVLYRVTSCEGLATPHRFIGTGIVDYSSRDMRHLPDAQAEVCGTLASLFPTAKVLLLTRGFRSMILSSYSQYVRSGGDRDLQELIANGREGDVWDYDSLVGLYASAFGETNVIVMPYELLRDDEEKFIREIEGRLGLAHFRPAPGRVNPSLSGEEMSWYPRLTRTVRRLPIGRPLRMLYLRGAMANRFRAPIRILQRLSPARPVTATMIPDELLEGFRGNAERLRHNSLFAPYASDYLL